MKDHIREIPRNILEVAQSTADFLKYDVWRCDSSIDKNLNPAQRDLMGRERFWRRIELGVMGIASLGFGYANFEHFKNYGHQIFSNKELPILLNDRCLPNSETEKSSK